jgi:hypothetical protein
MLSLFTQFLKIRRQDFLNDVCKDQIFIRCSTSQFRVTRSMMGFQIPKDRWRNLSDILPALIQGENSLACYGSKKTAPLSSSLNSSKILSTTASRRGCPGATKSACSLKAGPYRTRICHTPNSARSTRPPSTIIPFGELA